MYHAVFGATAAIRSCDRLDKLPGAPIGTEIKEAVPMVKKTSRPGQPMGMFGGGVQAITALRFLRAADADDISDEPNALAF